MLAELHVWGRNSRQHALHLCALLRGLLRVERLELLEDLRGVVVVSILGAFVPGQFALVAVAVGERVENGLGVRVCAVHLAALRRSGRQGQVLQFYSKARRAGVHVVQGLDQDVFGYSRVQQGAEELLLQRCQLGYHFRKH